MVKSDKEAYKGRSG